MASVVVADDHPLLLDGMVGLLQAAGHDVVARCRDGSEAQKAIRTHDPDLAILDIHMPDPSGIDLLREARTAEWRTKIIILTATTQTGPVMEAVQLHVDGLIMKGAGGETLLLCLQRVLAGDQFLDRDAMRQIVSTLAHPTERPLELTRREQDVAQLVARGNRNKEIARMLDISEGTVKMHLHNLYDKLNVSSRTELAIMMRENGLS
jgi:two-component system, NarL family, nitrate/nitrite response regulator NarL